MYDYGLSCGNPKQKKHWLRMAAEEGHVQAMYLLSQECDDSANADVGCEWPLKRAMSPPCTNWGWRAATRMRNDAGWKKPPEMAGKRR